MSHIRRSASKKTSRFLTSLRSVGTCRANSAVLFAIAAAFWCSVLHAAIVKVEATGNATLVDSALGNAFRRGQTASMTLIYNADKGHTAPSSTLTYRSGEFVFFEIHSLGTRLGTAPRGIFTVTGSSFSRSACPAHHQSLTDSFAADSFYFLSFSGARFKHDPDHGSRGPDQNDLPLLGMDFHLTNSTTFEPWPNDRLPASLGEFNDYGSSTFSLRYCSDCGDGEGFGRAVTFTIIEMTVSVLSTADDAGSPGSTIMHTQSAKGGYGQSPHPGETGGCEGSSWRPFWLGGRTCWGDTQTAGEPYCDDGLELDAGVCGCLTSGDGARTCRLRYWKKRPVNAWARDRFDRRYGLPMPQNWENLGWATELRPAMFHPLEDGLYIFVFRQKDDKLLIRRSDRPDDVGDYSCGDKARFSFAGNPSKPEDDTGKTETPHMFVRHTQLNGGWEDVWSAGQLEVHRGKVVWISNASGHYHPPETSLEYVRSVLGKWGLMVKFSTGSEGFLRGESWNKSKKDALERGTVACSGGSLVHTELR